MTILTMTSRNTSSSFDTKKLEKTISGLLLYLDRGDVKITADLDESVKDEFGEKYLPIRLLVHERHHGTLINLYLMASTNDEDDEYEVYANPYEDQMERVDNSPANIWAYLYFERGNDGEG